MSDVSSQYQKLDQRTHIETRPSMYVGSIANEECEKWVLTDSGAHFEKVSLTYNAGLLKLFDEILMNSVDEAVKGNVTQIDVEYSPIDGEITVSDNGGIPVVKHKDHDQYIPEMIFGEFMAGSNFGDERQGAGMNGFGAKLVVVFSKRFQVLTSDGKKSFSQVFTDNMRHRTTPAIRDNNQKGTVISYVPDYKKFDVTMDINSPDYKMMEKRVYDVAACNPHIKITFCDKEIKFKSFEQYVKMYNQDTVSEVTDNFSVTITPSQNDSFEAVSFVNNIDTYNGGTHIDYVTSQIIAEIRADIKRRYKIDVKPNNIKQQLNVFVSCNINSPMFTSQTKEFLSSPVKDYGTSYTPSKAFIKKVLASKVVEQVVAWAEGERRRQDEAELKKLDKASKESTALKRIIKFDDAGSRNRDECSLILTEGDSARKSLISARDPVLHGLYPLKGKPLNVKNVSASKLASNAEFGELIRIMGVSASKRNNISDLRYGKILIAADYDLDGCLTGDTLIPLVDGRVLPISELEKEEEFYVWSCTESGEVVAGRGHSSRVTKQVKKLLHITLDNGEVVRATHNHPFMLRDGNFVRADKLSIGASLMPFKTHDGSECGFMANYTRVFDPKTNRYKFAHHIVADGVFGERTKGVHVHHKDHNQKNNAPCNLELMNASDHLSYHAKTSSLVVNWNGSQEQKDMLSSKRLEGVYDNAHWGYTWNGSEKHRQWLATPEVKCAMKERGKTSALVTKWNGSTENSNTATQRNHDMWNSDKIYKDGKTYSEYMRYMSKIRGEDPLFVEEISKSATKQWKDENIRYAMQISRVATVIINALESYGCVNEENYNSLKPKTGVPKYENAVKKYGGTESSLLMNVKMFVDTRPDKVSETPKAKAFFAQYNHTVIDIKEVECDTEIDVWDITVDKYHNFALNSGCFVHNSHICGLLINMFHQFWPELIKRGLVYRLKTPLIIASVGKNKHEFFDKTSYFEWAETAPKHSYKYFKGLSSFTSKEMEKYIGDEKNCWIPIEYDDDIDECISLSFDKSRANDRKLWLETGVDDDVSI